MDAYSLRVIAHFLPVLRERSLRESSRASSVVIGRPLEKFRDFSPGCRAIFEENVEVRRGDKSSSLVEFAAT